MVHGAYTVPFFVPQAPFLTGCRILQKAVPVFGFAHLTESCLSCLSSYKTREVIPHWFSNNFYSRILSSDDIRCGNPTYKYSLPHYSWILYLQICPLAKSVFVTLKSILVVVHRSAQSGEIFELPYAYVPSSGQTRLLFQPHPEMTRGWTWMVGGRVGQGLLRPVNRIRIPTLAPHSGAASGNSFNTLSFIFSFVKLRQ